MLPRPAAFNAAFAFENGFEPKKPLCADSGDGCGAFKIVWRDASISGIFFCAGHPKG